MRIHNTLSRKVEEFKPIKAGQASLYTCGPTVYDYSHLGNLRAYVFDDTLRRALGVAGYKVAHVMNITDVGHLSSDEDEGEDKLEKGASREHKTVWEVADFYIKAFLKDTKALNVLEPNAYSGPHGKYARATDFIDEQLRIVGLLIDKKFAYKTEQAIYFDVTKLSDYGKLTGQKLSEKEVAARSDVVTDEAKRNPPDFAVWFFKVGRFADHSMSWPSQWGDGFPGWHLECSAIIHATLGEPIDMHTGGVDHIGTHHTNEIAQTEAAFGVKLANYWVHNEHLLVDGKKMSKSLGNFYTLSDVVQKGYDPLALRLLFLQSHYRSQMNLTWESLDAAQTFLKHLQAWADMKFQPRQGNSPKYEEILDKAADALLSDLNTPKALSHLSGLVAESEDNAIEPKELQLALEKVDKMFGLGLSAREDVDEQIKQMLERRAAARSQQDWIESDNLRGELKEAGIEVDDSPAGQVWRRA